MTKPLQINPLKLSQPMGAMLGYLGIKNCMPLMHGAQGCASFSKVFFTRHFSDPMAIQTTAVNDITAVIDGGDYSISEAIKNITKKVKPELVGLFTTGLTETKGDDIKGASFLLKDKQKIVYSHTPDFEGGLESGWAIVVNSIIEQLVPQLEPHQDINKNKILILPNVNFTPLETESVKETLELLDFEVFALPDLSNSLDGHLGEKQGTLSSGGISIQEIENLSDSGLVISIGESMKKSGQKFIEKNEKTTHLHFDSLSGLIESDNFYKQIMQYKNISDINPKIKKWRKRLQDALLDTHFNIGNGKFIIADEPDKAFATAELITEAGGNIELVVVSQRSEINSKIRAKKVIIGDLDDLEEHIKAETEDNKSDLLISNFHVERIADKYHKAFMIRGFPNYEQVGNQLKNDLLYRGSSYMLFEISNILSRFNHLKHINSSH
jgi:nitrogenase molybdenum-iron protein NifN